MLLVQRTPDKHDPDEAFARWEVPGGKLDDGESSWDAALREWSEETGGSLDALPVGGWVDGDYEGFVVRIDHEADIILSPQPDEVSNAQWWDPEDLDDDRVRDKVVSALGMIRPLLKATWSDFHRHTDQIIDHYAPTVRSAMRQLHEGDTVHRAILAGFGSAQKTVQKATTTLTRPRMTPTAAAGLGIGAGAGAAGAAGVAGGTAAALAALHVSVAGTAALGAVISAIYLDAYLQGAHEAAQASGGQVPPSVAAVPVPEGYWENWVPGVARAARQVAGPGLSRLLAEATVVVREVTQTQLSRIGDAIARGIERGFPVAEVEREVAGILETDRRAWLIAETEYARAMTAGARETYKLNNVPEVQWLHQPGACTRCMANADVSPIPVTDSWPNGNVPVHPRCRCAEAPYVRAGR